MKKMAARVALMVCFALATFPSAQAQDAAAQTSQPQSSTVQTAPAQSATAPAAAASMDPAKRAAILKLMDLTGMNKLSQNLETQMMDQMRAALQHSLPPGGRSEEIVNVFFKKFKARVGPDSVTHLIIPIYDKYLSQEELNGLIQFYQTPLGQKMIRIMPQISQESYKAGSEWGTQIALDVIHEMSAQYPELKSIQ